MCFFLETHATLIGTESGLCPDPYRRSGAPIATSWQGLCPDSVLTHIRT